MIKSIDSSTSVTNRSLSLSLYFSDLNACSIQKDKLNKLYKMYFETKSEKYKSAIVCANAKFVVSLAKQYQHMGLSLDDLIMEGNIGLIKAVELYDPATGKTYTSFRTHQKKQRPFNIVKIGLNRPREELYERINARVLKMVEEGLEQEARDVFPLRHLNSLNTVGFKEMFAYFDGLIPREEAIRQIQSNTRQYMRKQLTWFKKDDTIRWFSPDNIEDILKYIDSIP